MCPTLPQHPELSPVLTAAFTPQAGAAGEGRSDPLFSLFSLSQGVHPTRTIPTVPGAAQQWFYSLAPGQLTSLDIQMVVGQEITPVIPSKGIIDVFLLFIVIIIIILLEELLINGETCQAELPLVG